ncbi:MAG: HAD family hydrolase [Pygmaiobacter sp.]
MIQTLSDILVVSDLDNTLLPTQQKISSCNTTMIRLFCKLGGHFTIASERSATSVKRYLGDLQLSDPAIVCGGGVLYDFSEDCAIDTNYLDQRSATRMIVELLPCFQHLGIEILSDNGRTYVVNPNKQLCKHAVEEAVDYVVCELCDVPGNWYKAIFWGNKDDFRLLSEIVEQRAYENANFSVVDPFCCELLPPNITKGTALKKLCTWTEIPLENTYAIGDYYNDLDLLATAGHGIAIGNAVAAVQMQCEQTVLSCTDGGVAELLYRLMKQYSK